MSDKFLKGLILVSLISVVFFSGVVFGMYLSETPRRDVVVSATVEPTAAPTVAPTMEPTAAPTVAPTMEPTALPTVAPTAPTTVPTVEPTNIYTVTFTVQVLGKDTFQTRFTRAEGGFLTKEEVQEVIRLRVAEMYEACGDLNVYNHNDIWAQDQYNKPLSRDCIEFFVPYASDRAASLLYLFEMYEIPPEGYVKVKFNWRDYAEAILWPTSEGWSAETSKISSGWSAFARFQYYGDCTPRDFWNKYWKGERIPVYDLDLGLLGYVNPEVVYPPNIFCD